jgi:hypothetical protein
VKWDSDTSNCSVSPPGGHPWAPTHPLVAKPSIEMCATEKGGFAFFLDALSLAPRRASLKRDSDESFSTASGLPNGFPLSKSRPKDVVNGSMKGPCLVLSRCPRSYINTSCTRHVFPYFVSLWFLPVLPISIYLLKAPKIVFEFDFMPFLLHFRHKTLTRPLFIHLFIFFQPEWILKGLPISFYSTLACTAVAGPIAELFGYKTVVSVGKSGTVGSTAVMRELASLRFANDTFGEDLCFVSVQVL